MEIIYNEEKLKRILNDFHILTGVSISFIDLDGNIKIKVINSDDFCSNVQKSFTKELKCKNCDNAVVEKCKQNKCFEAHICHENLYDAALPIKKNGILAGYLLMGRIRIESSIPNDDYKNNEKLLRLYNNIPLFSQSKIDALKSILPEILFTNAITIKQEPILDKISAYITQNLNSELSVNELCKSFFVSRNKLYKHFNEGLGCTVNEYITKQRLLRSKALLKDTNLTVENIANSVGIGNYAYFCRLFKQHEHMTPSEFRKATTNTAKKST